jgi:hypothetical protein
MPTTVSMAGSTSILATVSILALSMLILALSMSILALVDDGAGESVDQDPVFPTVGAN